MEPSARLPASDRLLNRNVFLNVPYDDQFSGLFVAYVAGLITLGLEPRASLEIPGGESRLDRIIQLISECSQSVHDLSRVELDLAEPHTPRFNMPFELGIVVGWHHNHQGPAHTWSVFEANERRLKKSLSDLAGTDAYVHHGTPKGVLSELLNAFVRSPRQPTMLQMEFVFQSLKESLEEVLAKAGSPTLFKARAFLELLAVARGLTLLVFDEP